MMPMFAHCSPTPYVRRERQLVVARPALARPYTPHGSCMQRRTEQASSISLCLPRPRQAYPHSSAHRIRFAYLLMIAQLIPALSRASFSTLYPTWLSTISCGLLWLRRRHSCCFFQASYPTRPSTSNGAPRRRWEKKERLVRRVWNGEGCV